MKVTITMICLTLSHTCVRPPPVPEREPHDLPLGEDEEHDAALDAHGDDDDHDGAGQLLGGHDFILVFLRFTTNVFVTSLVSTPPAVASSPGCCP